MMAQFGVVFHKAKSCQMDVAMDIPTQILDREIVVTRFFNVSQDRLWQAWSDPHQLALWWGPHGFSNTFHRHEFTPGGHWDLTMHGPDGTDYANALVYRVIDVPERIVVEHLSAPQFLLIAEFETVGKRSKLTFRQLFDTAETCAAVRAICVPANEDNLDRMAAVVSRP
jgi:uncharacterized protein YndB with AHSA1/START domain